MLWLLVNYPRGRNFGPPPEKPGGKYPDVFVPAALTINPGLEDPLAVVSVPATLEFPNVAPIFASVGTTLGLNDQFQDETATLGIPTTLEVEDL